MKQRIKKLLEYRDGKLYWKVQRGRCVVGSEAGAIAVNGRVYVQLDGKKHLAHRIVWIMHNETCPEFLDHIDGNPLNNCIENLRPATKAQNAMNRVVKSDNKLGVKGVCKRKNKYAAQIYAEGKNIFIGLYDSVSEAAEAYKQAANKHFGEFAHV